VLAVFDDRASRCNRHHEVRGGGRHDPDAGHEQ
jgi:hypothetical protein